ncbi:hypothetical protein [uncultured Methylobacterium sp.]|jgi:hypothetical protein|uniref:hypothetical protein n=1 Tax=uncultured Methylobacterium sp. TaxID=157278 RepID=UPI00260FB6AD|nr:hypothetical protein [uncultured Methylobacterium sp.]
MRPAYALLLLIGPLAGPALAQGAPRSVGDCERIRGDLAYNQCLSLFGPAAPIKAATGAAIPAMPAPAVEARLPQTASAAEAEAPRSYRGRSRYGRQLRLGRQRATFAAISGSRRHYRRR